MGLQNQFNHVWAQVQKRDLMLYDFAFKTIVTK